MIQEMKWGKVYTVWTTRLYLVDRISLMSSERKMGTGNSNSSRPKLMTMVFLKAVKKEGSRNSRMKLLKPCILAQGLRRMPLAKL